MARESRRIAPTAHFTAQAWVAEGFPNAELFDTRTGRLLFEPAQRFLRAVGPWAPSLPWHTEFLYIRHHAYETRLRQLAPDYVLEVGAGLSPRGLTFCQDNPSLEYVEADLPHMVRAKRERLARVALPSGYHLAAVDLLGEGFVESLPVRPRKGSRVVVVTEGVTDYLSMDQKWRAFSNIARLLRCAGGGHYLFEAYTWERLERYARSARAAVAALSALVGARMDRRLFMTTGDALRAVQSAGFVSAEVLDLAALNTSRHHPDMGHRHFDLIEARVA